MAIQVYPLNISPSTINYQYDMTAQPFTAVGGTAPYIYSLTGNLPPGMALTSPVGGGAIITGVPLVADQYQIGQSNFAPGAFNPSTGQAVIVNPSTFTIIATDSLAATGSTTYTLPVGVFTEEQCISIFEMLRAAYDLDWYIVLADMGTRNVRIGDIGNAAFGGVRMMVNSMLSLFTSGMIIRMKQYICEWDNIKLVFQRQVNGGVTGITGINMDWARDKKTAILELVKTILPAFSRAEVEARQAHHGGSDFTGSLTGGGGSGVNHVTLVR